MENKTAILIDGGFLATIFKQIHHKDISPDDVISISNKIIHTGKDELFRIYYYNAPPFGKKLINPIDHSERDYSRSSLFQSMEKFHRELAEKEFVALRLGEMSFKGWKLTEDVLKKIREKTFTTITPNDLMPDFKQKAVDMRVGLDIAWLSTKKIVDTIVLLTGDNDFIPAMKFARKEGLHVAVVMMKTAKGEDTLNSDMLQHADRIIHLKL